MAKQKPFNVTESRPPRPSLRDGTYAHYADADYYDRAYRRHRADVDFYLQTTLEHGGPVLELGCGTGRMTLPVACAGVDVVGVDLSHEMLRAAKQKVETQSEKVQSHIELRQADLRELRLGRTFRLIISPFNVMQHLYTLDDLERGLAVVRRHLMPRAGRFVFDVLMPDIRGLGRNPGKRYKMGQVYHPAGDKRYDYRESFDYDEANQIEHITMWFDDPDDPEASFSTPLAHRQFFPLELMALLRYNGFEVVERWGSFDREPINEDSASQIFVCRLSSRRTWR